PAVGPVSKTFTFDLLNDDTRERTTSPSQRTNLDYAATEPTHITGYTVSGVVQDPAAALATCLGTAKPSTGNLRPQDPGDFLGKVARSAADALHPCNVETCLPNAPRSTKYK